MSQAKRPPTEPTPGTQKTPDGEKPSVSFSLPQILGGALAAVTVAVLGSTLGTAGTVAGAALASVVLSIAGTLYTAGIDRTTKHAHHAIHKGLERVRGGEPTLPDGSPASTSQAPSAVTVAEGGQSTGTGAATGSSPGGKRPAGNPGRRKLIWRMGISAVAIFLIAAVAITGWELATGSTLSGTPGQTSFSRSRVADPPPTATAHRTTTQSPEPTATTTATHTATPTAPTATATPAAPTATSTPTRAPTAVTTPQSTALGEASAPVSAQERVEAASSASG